MTTKRGTYLNQMLQQIPQGTVVTSVWLKHLGISSNLQQYYKNNEWLQTVGTGAFARYGDTPTFRGAVYALQEQLGSDVHFGAKSALMFYGFNHFVQLEGFRWFLFSSTRVLKPKWFTEYFKHNNYQWVKSDFLPTGIGVNAVRDTFSVQVSEPERAILEMLYLTPDTISLRETYQTLELLVNLRPKLLQELLENCSSIKVKRLFLYMAEKINHAWFSALQTDKINIGLGKRTISKGGKLDKKYNIVIEEVGEI